MNKCLVLVKVYLKKKESKIILQSKKREEKSEKGEGDGET